jgi:hypothetical protein
VLGFTFVVLLERMDYHVHTSIWFDTLGMRIHGLLELFRLGLGYTYLLAFCWWFVGWSWVGKGINHPVISLDTSRIE